MMAEATVYIVDDDPDMRDSLRWLLKTVGLHVEVYGSAAEFLEDFAPVGPGCLVFDVRMPGMSGLDLYEAVVARGEGMPVIFITAYADVPMAIRAMKSGAIEFVEKPFNRQELLDRVQRAIQDDVERRRLLADREALRRRFGRLTEKEREVLELIKDGQPNKVISASLDITPRAVEMRRSSLMKKLGVRTLAGLLRLTIALEIASDGRKDTR
jgi:two-component system, LuxR family, response regulator FixJ